MLCAFRSSAIEIAGLRRASENERGEIFETTRLYPTLEELSSRSAREIADGLNLAAVDLSRAKDRQEDDYTVVVLKGV